jgi:plasmid stability protein
LSLDDELYAVARQRAFDEHRSVGDVVSSLIRKGLEAEKAVRTPRPLGKFRGQISTREDFNETPAEVELSMNKPFA